MADPTNATTIPHLMGITLDSTGVATTIVVAKNRRTGERQSQVTDSNKLAVFDAAGFEDGSGDSSGYTTGDVIEFENCGATLGGATITINSSTGGFQDVEITCTAAPTGVVNL